MSAPTSPPTSPRNKSKLMECKVLQLDDNLVTFQVPTKSVGQDLYNVVLLKLELLEADYFDLQYTDVQGMLCWLDHDKQILRQVSHHSLDFQFVVKFYTPDPGLLEEEYTRYLFALQVKRDLSSGAMPCQEHTAVLLASYIVQAEFGDYVEGDEIAVGSYLRNAHLLPKQNEPLERQIMEHHREHVGQNPADAEFNLLDTARKVDLYGIQMHAAKDHETVPLHLAVAHMGILVFQNQTKINTFSWAKIRKLSFKRKKFLVKLHPDGYGYYKDTVEFYFESRNECKNFWKKCLEHHAFFRCHAVKRLPRNKTRVMSRGSSFRYSGRTQKQLIEHVRENFNKRPTFQRSTSLRTVSMGHSAVATPKTGTLRSRDFHLGHHLSLSSGSRIINAEQRVSTEEIPKVNGNDVHASTHDGPTPSQSHSMQTFQLGEDGKNATPPPFGMTPGDKEGSYDNLVKHRPSMELRTEVIGGDRDIGQRPEALNFSLTKDRNSSAPAFPVSEESRLVAEAIEARLSRSPDMENIPERIEGDPDALAQNRLLIHHSQSVGVFLDKPRPAGDPGPALAQASAEDRFSPCLSPLVTRSNAFADGLRDGSLHSNRSSQDTPMKPSSVRADLDYADAYQHRSSSARHNSASIEREDRNRVGESVVVVPKPSAAVSNGNIPSAHVTSSEDDLRRKFFANTAYYIAKELLMTERTYKKDLEIVTIWFRNAMSRDDGMMSSHPLDLLFRLYDPLYEFHCLFQKDLEMRMAAWESKSLSTTGDDHRRIGDLMLRSLAALPSYQAVFEHQEEILLGLDAATHDNPVFEQLFKEFEMQKVCYLSFSTFLLKPFQRLLHYQLILNRFLQFYKPDHPDYDLCSEALRSFNEVTQLHRGKSRSFENLQKLVELQQDLIGIENLILPSREFIREGCLQKLSRKGYHQRMFFLFSDLLVYTSRSTTRSLQFTVHGQLDITKMAIDETDPKIAVANSFSIYTGSHCLVVAASSEAEKTKWVEDIQMAIINARRWKEKKTVSYPSLKSNSSSESSEEIRDGPSNSLMFDRPAQQRTNTLMHVCWHRNTSISMRECSLATRNCLSGFLLRKFKNTTGWQKLWVSFTNFCLFFYKSYQDDFPLASLPLLGYSVQLPNSSDAIQKDFVFKLQFKNHIYFFRAESQYTFDRWVEAIHTATGNAQHMRMFSRMDSYSGTSPDE